LHTPALQIGTHFLLTLETIVFVFHLLSATSKSAFWVVFFYKNALYKFTVILYYYYYYYYYYSLIGTEECGHKMLQSTIPIPIDLQ